jgi:hypothetical protein
MRARTHRHTHTHTHTMCAWLPPNTIHTIPPTPRDTMKTRSRTQAAQLTGMRTELAKWCKEMLPDHKFVPLSNVLSLAVDVLEELIHSERTAAGGQASTRSSVNTLIPR